MAVVVRSKLSRGTEVQLSPFHKIVYRCQQKLQISPNRIVWDHPKILLEMWTLNKGRGKSDTKELLSESKCNYWTKSRRRSCLRNLSFGLIKKVPKSLEIYRQQRRNCGIRHILHWRKYISLSFHSSLQPLQSPNSPLCPYDNVVLISARERKTDDPTNSHQFWMLPWVLGLNFFSSILSCSFFFLHHLFSCLYHLWLLQKILT